MFNKFVTIRSEIWLKAKIIDDKTERFFSKIVFLINYFQVTNNSSIGLYFQLCYQILRNWCSLCWFIKWIKLIFFNLRNLWNAFKVNAIQDCMWASYVRLLERICVGSYHNALNSMTILIINAKLCFLLRLAKRWLLL